ncbi:hypothetical protein [Novosphingobium sp. PY1]|jgi:hypothetical protein|uniref:Ribonucleoside-diphosphate reductase n=1 Tax=Ochrobactrum sp. PW1 TaxID=1882222 RepID=A0A292GT49_9HYPH|nr:hypothetical protein [Novosphingobium sp. PY1]BBA74262.1 ribonucleoside-diphosphate reductase [Ochrobactrum sp. PW1]GFM29111.1 ribonucleoside-diphosphate reductase [Novosphingobium sp. PY1]
MTRLELSGPVGTHMFLDGRIDNLPSFEQIIGELAASSPGQASLDLLSPLIVTRKSARL